MTGNPFGILFDVIACMILYGGYTRLNFCSMIVYIFLAMNSLVDSFMGVGKIAQQDFDDLDKVTSNFGFWYVFIALCFYTFAVYWAF